METLDQDEPLAKRMERHAYDRLIMLSDGVFAIAVTLLALELRPNGPVTGDAIQIVRHFAPKLIAYVVSFLVIGVFWVIHRRVLARFRRVDRWATWLNLLMLAMVALIPAATSLLYDLREAGTTRLYLALITTVGLAQAMLWGYGAFIADLIFPEVSFKSRVYSLLANALSPPAYAALALWSIATGRVWGWVVMLVLILAVRLIRQRVFGGGEDAAAA
jgi:uncharacterized membrane protein